MAGTATNPITVDNLLVPKGVADIVNKAREEASGDNWSPEHIKAITDFGMSHSATATVRWWMKSNERLLSRTVDYGTCVP